MRVVEIGELVLSVNGETWLAHRSEILPIPDIRFYQFD